MHVLFGRHDYNLPSTGSGLVIYPSLCACPERTERALVPAMDCIPDGADRYLVLGGDLVQRLGPGQLRNDALLTIGQNRLPARTPAKLLGALDSSLGPRPD